MPWNGYNFEDSILISERLVADDVFTSIHIEEFELTARDTKLGNEEITRDLPNVSEESLGKLDEVGIVHVGAEVDPGDILVGKVTPKGESPMTPEEKLLRAIFGEKAADVRDTSLRMPSGASGTVIEVRVFSRRGVEKDGRLLQNEREEKERVLKDYNDEKAIYERDFNRRLEELLLNQKVASDSVGVKRGEVLTAERLSSLKSGELRRISVKDSEVMATIKTLQQSLQVQTERLKSSLDDAEERIQAGDELPPSVLKVVKVFVAVKRKIQSGDKMAGRHGNKGVISKIVPVEDMPYTEEGTPVDIVLNPLGVPSRMNVGQILETHLGWAAMGLGRQVGAMAAAVCRKEASMEDLKNHVVDLYDDEDSKKQIKAMKGDDLVAWGDVLAEHGLKCATPVFEGGARI